jgi:hypothetical protein
MNAFPARLNLTVWLTVLGAVLAAIAGPSPLVIRIPWLVLYAALVLVLAIGGPLLRNWLAGRVVAKQEEHPYD